MSLDSLLEQDFSMESPTHFNSSLGLILGHHHLYFNSNYYYSDPNSEHHFDLDWNLIWSFNSKSSSNGSVSSYS